MAPVLKLKVLCFMLETILWAVQVDSDPILVWLIWSSSFITCGLDAVLIGWSGLVQSYFILFAIISPAQHSIIHPANQYQAWRAHNIHLFWTTVTVLCRCLECLRFPSWDRDGLLVCPAARDHARSRYWQYRQLSINKRSKYSELSTWQPEIRWSHISYLYWSSPVVYVGL